MLIPRLLKFCGGIVRARMGGGNGVVHVRLRMARRAIVHRLVLQLARLTLEIYWTPQEKRIKLKNVFFGVVCVFLEKF